MSVSCRFTRSRSATFDRRCIGFALVFVIVVCVAPRVCAFFHGTWVDLNPDTPDRFTSVDLMDVDFISASTGVTVGANGTILRTVDRGVTWARVDSGTSTTLYGVDFIDAINATAVGSNGTILRSGDGGLTWFAQSSGTQETLLDVHFVDGLTGTAVGVAGTIVRTTDGGAAWSPQISGTNMSLTAVFFVNAQQGYAVGNKGTILNTTDGGDRGCQIRAVKYAAIIMASHFVTLSSMCNSWMQPMVSLWDFPPIRHIGRVVVFSKRSQVEAGGLNNLRRRLILTYSPRFPSEIVPKAWCSQGKAALLSPISRTTLVPAGRLRSYRSCQGP